VKGLLRWTLFCAATRRRPRLTLNWQPYFDIADTDLPFDEKLEQYDALARDHFEEERFTAFDERWLGRLDEVALEFFGSEQFKEIVHEKVASLYPSHEVRRFTAHFFGLVQFWRKTETERLERAR